MRTDRSVYDKMADAIFSDVHELFLFVSSCFEKDVKRSRQDDFKKEQENAAARLEKDVRAYRSDLQTLLKRGDKCSFKSVLYHRLAHFLAIGSEYVEDGARLVLRCNAFSFYAYSQGRLGVDVNPFAQIGGGLYLEESSTKNVGEGVVIGQQCVVGENAYIGRGVVMGAYLGANPKIAQLCLKRGRRHPSLGKNVHLSRGVRVVGPYTIGSRVWVMRNLDITRDVPGYRVVMS